MGATLQLANSTANRPTHCKKRWNMLLSFPVNKLRVFIAITLTNEIHDTLSVIIAQLKREFPDGVIRWVKVANIHLTLKFLGEIPETDVDRLKMNLESPIGCQSAFRTNDRGDWCIPEYLSTKDRMDRCARFH